MSVADRSPGSKPSGNSSLVSSLIIKSSSSNLCTVSPAFLPEISVTVVESKDIPSIGVGEATQPIVSEFIHDYLGFKEEYWMKECDATFKLALRFNQFNNNTLKDYIYHTFWSKEELSYHLYDWALKKQLYPLVPTRNYTASI